MPTYSYSRLNAFENCPYQYKLRYIDCIKVERDTIERFLGNTVHSTLEYLYKDMLKGNKRELEMVLKLYRWYWEKDFNKNIVIVKRQYGVDHYRKIGEKCIERYYGKHFPFNKNKILGLEEKISIKVDKEGKYALTGVVDRIDETPDGIIEIHDYKTGMTLPSQQGIEKETQLALYQVGLRDKYGNEKQIDLVWHYLMFGHEFVLRKTDDQLDVAIKKTVEIIERVENTKDFPPKKGPLCNYCDYYEGECKA